jgi:DNA segregation ATPase FtsK/SpoIIIE, S-DNA-T family
VTTKTTAEAVWLHSSYPGPREVLSLAAGPGRRLWERRPGETDHLILRLGLGRRRARITATRGGRPVDSPVELHDVPITIDLPAAGVLGVCGDKGLVSGVVRWLLAQVAAWHSPQDVRIVFLMATHATLSSWTWLTLLPHTREDDSQMCWSQVGALDRDGQARRRVVELEAVMEQRLRRSPEAGRDVWRPWYVMVLSDARRLRGMPGVARLLAHGSQVGIVAVCLDARRADLPLECRTVVELHPATAHAPPSATLTDPVGDASRLRVEAVSEDSADRFAQVMAPLRDATPSAETDLPAEVRLLELVGASSVEPHALLRRWSDHAGSTIALLGRSADGPYAIDLHHDGPHALVGGTTGSGKSELLQTLVASLAIANPPQRLGFVLVDYKGGAAFAECAELPHVLGLVTDLDEHLAERALTSLTAELRRRERLLRAAGAADIDDYARARRPDQPTLGRLVIVIDEFRMLADELPAFLDGVVRIAALGRSLGVHLILATQRPAGVVSADIAANVNLRIALRVRDRADSEDVIESPAAAAISSNRPGRALARAGANALVSFQCARVTGSSSAGGGPMQVTILSPEQLGAAPDPPSVARDSQPSDLAHIARCLREAARVAEGQTAHRPWLPPLPDVVTIDEVAVPEGSWHTPYGVVDQPERQSQHTLAWDLANESHLMVIGTVRTGRTSALRTIAGALGKHFDAGRVHLHAVDGGSGGLSAIQCLPHTGVVTSAEDAGRCARLLDLLTAEVAARRRAFSAAGLTSLAEQHQYADQPDHLPYLVLLVDGWEGVAAQWETFDHGRLVDAFHRLLRDGAGVGVRVALTGDRGLLVSRLGSSVRHRIVLRLADPADATLAGIPAHVASRRQPFGRGVRSADIAEVQLALLARDPAGPAQIAALQNIGQAARGRPRSRRESARPLRIEPLPGSVRLADLLSDGPELAAGAVLVGVGGDAATAVGLDVAGSSAIVAGPPRSGRSTALYTVSLGLLRRGHRVLAIALPGTPLTRLSMRWQSMTAVTGDDAQVLATVLGAERPSVVIVDDAEQLAGTESEDVVLGWFKTRPTNGCLVVAGTVDDMAASFRGLSLVARRSGSGLILNPSSAGDGDLLGVRLAVPSDGSVRTPGRGALVDSGRVTPVQVALPAVAD